MKVLFVTPYLPSPPRFGGQRRLHGLMREVAREHEVWCVSLVDPRRDVRSDQLATRQYCHRVVTAPGRRLYAPRAGKRALQLAATVTPWSYERLAYGSRRLQAELDAVTAATAFDVIQFEFAQMARYGAATARARGAPVRVLDEHNVEYDVVRRTAEAEVGRARRAYSALDWRKLRAEEREAWRTFDGCVLTSARDRQMLQAEEPGIVSCVVPNGVDVESFVPEAGRARPDTVLFFGAINYHPNTEGLLFFLREAWPRLKQRRPGVVLRIVGPDPPPELAAWPDASVKVVGYVDDIRAEIAAAAAVIAPLRIGGGTRLKVLEAMALGRPMVSTRLGAEGIDVTDRRDILLADEPADFADQVARLLEDPALGARLGAAARQLVVDRYSWRAAGERLVAFYAELGAPRRPRAHAG